MLNPAKHRRIMIDILAEIYSDPKIAHLLVFKGGTALYLFHGLNRFSVDLDFDLHDKDQQEFVFKHVLEILSKYGKIQDQAMKHFGSLIAINYEKGFHRLKLDISNRDPGGKFVVKNYLGIPMRIMPLEDITANKLIALTDRKNPAARDVFDIYFILKNDFDINEDVIKERSDRTLIEQLGIAIEHVEKNFEGDLLSALGELVDDKQKSWMKNKMKDDCLLALRIKLEAMSG